MSFNGPTREEVEAGEAPVVDCQGVGDRGFTVQAERDESDINKIIARFDKTGMISRLNAREPFYGDVSEFSNLAEAKMKVFEADRLFMNLEAGLRERFDNDPVKFIDFLDNPGNLDEAIKLGIVTKRPEGQEAPAGAEPVAGSPAPGPVS